MQDNQRVGEKCILCRMQFGKADGNRGISNPIRVCSNVVGVRVCSLV